MRDLEILRRVRSTGKPHIAPAPDAAVRGAWQVTVANWNYGWTDTFAAGFVIRCADLADAFREAAKHEPTLPIG